jgi:hypothetical protein
MRTRSAILISGLAGYSKWHVDKKSGMCSSIYGACAKAEDEKRTKVLCWSGSQDEEASMFEMDVGQK